MKKVIKLVLGLLLLFLISELIIFIFKNEHNITYELKDNKEVYKINEVYKDKKYYFKITSKKNTYSLEIDNDYNKRKEIITKIYSYKIKDLSCIYPAFKDKSSKSNIICSQNNKTYSYTYLQNDLQSFVKKLKKEGYKSSSWNKTSNKQKVIDTLKAYPNNIKENTYIFIYKYNGFFSINKDSLEKINLFKNDTYINHLGTRVDKYYVIPDYDQKYDYDKLYRIDMTNNKIKEIKLKKEISKDSYINGVIDNEIYLFDKDELIQYTINPKKKKVKEVGNKEDDVLYYNLGFKKISAYNFRDKEIKFKTMDNYIKKLEKRTSINYIEKSNDSYYYQTKDNNVYYYNNHSKTKVLLFNMEISDFKLVKDTIYFISNNSMYSYDFINGLDKLVTYEELSFNSHNRIAIYME